MATANVDHRSQAIRDGLESLYQLDKEIDDLIEKHIAPLRAEKRDIKKRLKDEYDVPVKRLNGRYAGYKEERRAIDNGDDNSLDAIRYLYDLAPVGQQMDWVDAVRGKDEDGEAFLRDKTAEAETEDAA